MVEYCSPVWDPHTQTQIKQVEAIQNRAARFVTGNYKRRSSVTAMKTELEWENLSDRRKTTRLTIFHQAIAGHLAIPVQKALRPVKRSLRHTSPSANNFIPITTNKDCFKFSFIPRTLVDWNNLPSNLTIIPDKEHFKEAFKEHLKTSAARK
ncbi:uncharacterized protein [Amphiura filiformis]|uniref:uncharacterized protein n=1 Tax=Amphiura filiformis TaxID=82378 RepID=UPI003B20DEA6